MRKETGIILNAGEQESGCSIDRRRNHSEEAPQNPDHQSREGEAEV